MLEDFTLNSEMMANANGMNKQLLSVGSMLIIATLVMFIIGMGSNANVIIENTDIDTENAKQTWASEGDQDESVKLL